MRSGRWRNLVLLGAALAAAALPLAGIVRRLPPTLREDCSIGDLATIEIMVIEASHARRLVGQPGRFGFYQLGPSHAYVQVPLYLLLHGQRYALSLTCLLVNWAAFLGALYALARWFDTTAAVVPFALVAVLYFGFYDSATLFNYWGQYLIVLPAALFLLSAAATAAGRVATWPLTLALGSFLMQGYGSSLLPVGAVLGALALVGGPRLLRERRLLAASLAVLALFWCGTVIDQLTTWPGNLRMMLWHYLRAKPGPAPPLDAVTAGFARQLAAPWLHALWRMTVNSPLEGGRLAAAKGLAAAHVLLLAFCAWLAARRRQRYSAALCALCLLTVLASLVAVRRLEGGMVPYIFFWLSACCAAGWAAVGGVLLSALAARWTELPAAGRRRPAALARHREAWVLGLALAFAAGLFVWPIPVPLLGDANVVPLAEALERHLEERGLAARPVRLVSHDFAWPWSLAMLIQLDHRGHRVWVANVQKGVERPGLEGLRPLWLRPLPGSTEIHLYDRDPGAVVKSEKISCHPVLNLNAAERVICMYRTLPSAGGGLAGREYDRLHETTGAVEAAQPRRKVDDAANANFAQSVLEHPARSSRRSGAPFRCPGCGALSVSLVDAVPADRHPQRRGGFDLRRRSGRGADEPGAL